MGAGRNRQGGRQVSAPGAARWAKAERNDRREGAAFFNLFWASPGIPQQNLPTSRLYPAAPGKVRSVGGTATASAGGGGEGPAQAFDGNSGSKWNTGANGATAWLQYQFAVGATWAVNQYRLTSAGDVPERDPKSWQLLGSNNNGVSWTPLDMRTNQTFAGRGQTNTYSIANTTPYASYRLDVTANNGGAGYSIQLAELALLSPSSLPAPPASLTLVPGDKQVTVSWPALSGATSSQVKRSVYDGGPHTPVARVTSGPSFVDTKLVNGIRYYYVVSTASPDGEGANSAQATVLLATALAVPTGLSAAAGNAQVSLQWNASSGATSYTVKRSTTSGGGYTNAATGVTGTSYANTGLTNGTTYYYVVIATNATGTSGNSAQASATPAIGGNTSSNDNTNSFNEDPSKAFDGSSGSKWCIGGGAAWLQYQFASGQVITGYVITSANDVPERDPRNWTFQGSNDGTTWVDLDVETAQTFTGRNQAKVYAAANATAYTRYRLNVTANAGGAAFGLQLAELSFLSTLPSPWSTGDIGATGALGGAAALTGTFAMRASGADIWGTADAFRYVHQAASGDCSITARVIGLQNTHGAAKAGVMIRESLNANSTEVTCAITPSGMTDMIVRSVTGGSSTWTGSGGSSAPYWVRIARSGSTFTTSRSPDGVTWSTVGTQTVTMGTNVYIGLVGCSHVSGTLTNAGFDNVTAVP